MLPGSSFRVVASKKVTGDNGQSLVAYRSGPLRARLEVQDGELSGAWSRQSDHRAIGGRYDRERTPGASFSTMVQGDQATVWFMAGPNQGRMQERVDGRVRAAETDAKAKHKTYQQRRTFGGLGAGTHAIVVMVLGTLSRASTDSYVSLDAISGSGSGCSRDTVCRANPSDGWQLAHVASADASD